MLYAIKSDTLFFNRQANRADLDAFSYLYPLADATMIRKMEGVGNHGRAARLRDQGLAARPHGRARLLRVSSASRRARTSSPTSPTSTCSSRTCSGRSSRAWSTTRSSCRSAISATHATPAISCGAGSTTSAAQAAIARWPRRSCRSKRFNEVRHLRRQPHQSADAGAGAGVPARIRQERPRRTRRDAKDRPKARRSLRSSRRLQARHTVYASACRRSAIRSSGSSRPIDSRIIPRVTPARCQLLVGEAVLRRENRQAAQALDAAEACGALDDLEPIERTISGRLPALHIDADHAAEARHLARRDGVIGMRGQTRVVDALDRGVAFEKLRHRHRVGVVPRDAQAAASSARGSTHTPAADP